MSKHAPLSPHSGMNGSITTLAYSLYHHRQLIYTLAKKDILGRYKQALIGVAWTFITPLLTLIIYTFVFSEIFKVRWNGSDANGSKLEFALIIFSGMIIFSFFSEIMIRSTTIISVNVNYVKKVIFPLEILPIIVLCEAGFHALVSIGVLLTLVFFRCRVY
jgi:lipopolysaccharide transport system permease protein